MARRSGKIDTSKPHPARMYNVYLGGSDNYPADCAAVAQILRDFPEARDIALANRAFMQRAVRFLAAEAGIRQFLDIGAGIPSARQDCLTGQDSSSPIAHPFRAADASVTGINRMRSSALVMSHG